MAIRIFCDERSDELLAEVVLAAEIGTSGWTIERLPSLANAPEYLRALLEWERFDWVICVGQKIVGCIEFSRHGYTGDNGFQRFGRLYRSISLEYPTVYVTPFSRTRLNEVNDGQDNPRNVAPELFRTLLDLEVMHGTPVLALDWPTGGHGIPQALIHPQSAKLRHRIRDAVSFLVDQDMEGLSASFADEHTAMERQAAIGWRGSDTRGAYVLKTPVTQVDWILDFLPPRYFKMGKADKALAAMALARRSERDLLGDLPDALRGVGPTDIHVLYLGYQWRPDPATGLIALAAAQARGRGVPLVVVWPRVFVADSPDRRGALSALRDFKASAKGPLKDELRRQGFDDESIARFRTRLSIDPSQFGIFSLNSKVGRVLKSVTATVVFGDALLSFGL